MCTLGPVVLSGRFVVLCSFQRLKMYFSTIMYVWYLEVWPLFGGSTVDPIF